MSDERRIEVSVPEQRLWLFEGAQCRFEAAVSTARKGVGEIYGSERTPRGWHVVRAKIGAGCPPGMVFVGRRPTGEIYSPELRARHPDRDWILTRILWLGGLERGKNRLGRVDTLRRFIYIHGSPDEDPVEVPTSHGCIKLRTDAMIRLFELTDCGTRVLIRA
jgi:lipoprotein-anchoring transpeptidase ErfK/SrfK